MLDVSISPKSVAYLACTRVGDVSRKATAMCLADRNTFSNGIGLLLANGIINPNREIFGQVVNVMETPVNVKNGNKSGLWMNANSSHTLFPKPFQQTR